MRLVGRKKLEKLKRKNKGNTHLVRAIELLVADIEENEWVSHEELLATRPDADRVHPDGFYFFDLHIHRSLILIEFDDGEATIVWAGNHADYEAVFKNNKATIRKWLKFHGYIE